MEKKNKIKKKWAWVLTGSGHFFNESIAIIKKLKEIDLFVSKAAEEVLVMYKKKGELPKSIKIFKDNIKPFEILFFQVGAEILKNMSGFLAVSPDKAVQKIRQDVAKALKDLQKPDNLAKLEKLKIQIEKLEAIGGSSAIVPSEGIVFKYKGNIYKFTGAFAPVNQILGSLRF